MSLSDFEELMREVIDGGGEFLLKTNGKSMEPLFHDGRDTVALVKPLGRLERGDIAFYKRANGAYVLHRVIKVFPDKYIFRGDNQISKEIVCDNMIIAAVSAIIRNGTRIELTDRIYKNYMRKLPFQFAKVWLKNRTRAVIRRLKRVGFTR